MRRTESAPPEPDGGWQRLVQRFDHPAVQSLVLMGSYARGDPSLFSDVDLVRFTTAGAPALPGNGSHLLDGRLVVVSDIRPEQTEAWFAQPESAVSHIAGLRQARPLVDHHGWFAILQARAQAFVWDTELQAQADAYANAELVGLIEEVHKGLEGLRRGDVGRLLNAEFGLSWGLNRVVQVQRGVLLSGDNTFFQQVEDAVGPATNWARLRRQAFGVNTDDRPPTLDQRVVAGLHLYIATVELLAAILTAEAANLIDQTVRLVRDELGQRAASHPNAVRPLR